ncbi:unnamed protein product [Arctia plantaginis]|uniref:Uncharacterized protein n=1 Tax=Arctia plantaginis TaxID=874455 RepID=A0A8S1BSY4_ARCPL|nr:unnamed protein product [Arctia plantaginis]
MFQFFGVPRAQRGRTREALEPAERERHLRLAVKASCCYCPLRAWWFVLAWLALGERTASPWLLRCRCGNGGVAGLRLSSAGLRKSSGAAEMFTRRRPGESGYVSIGGPLFYRYGATRVHCGGDDDEFDRHPVFGVLFGDSSYCGCTLTYCYCTTYISYT